MNKNTQNVVNEEKFNSLIKKLTITKESKIKKKKSEITLNWPFNGKYILKISESFINEVFNYHADNILNDREFKIPLEVIFSELLNEIEDERTVSKEIIESLVLLKASRIEFKADRKIEEILKNIYTPNPAKAVVAENIYKTPTETKTLKEVKLEILDKYLKKNKDENLYLKWEEEYNKQDDSSWVKNFKNRKKISAKLEDNLVPSESITKNNIKSIQFESKRVPKVGDIFYRVNLVGVFDQEVKFRPIFVHEDEVKNYILSPFKSSNPTQILVHNISTFSDFSWDDVVNNEKYNWEILKVTSFE